MDVELVDEVTELEVSGSLQHQSKNDEYSLNPRCYKLLKPQIIHNDYAEIPPPEFVDISQGKNVVEAATGLVATSEHLHPSHFLDGDACNMVEELTVKSYDGSSLDIGTSSSRKLMYNGQSQRGHLYQPASNSGMGDLVSDAGYINNGQATKSLGGDQGNTMRHLENVEHGAEQKEDVNDASGRIRTKMVSRSGFAEYFIKSTLKGKGIVCKGPSSNGSCVESREQSLIKVDIATQNNSKVSVSTGSKTAKPPHTVSSPRPDGSACDGVTLRECLKSGSRKRSKTEHLNIFRNIVDFVDGYHSRGVALQNLCPSYFKLLPSNQVMYLGLPPQKQMLDNVTNSEVLEFDNFFTRKRTSEKVIPPFIDMRLKKQKFNENVGVTGELSERYPRDEQIWRMPSITHMSTAGLPQLTSLNESLEDKWYTSPEGGCSTSSNIYCLGVLFFELLGHFDSERAHIAAMSDLCNRILPPVFLSENLKEAGFCLLLLHPEPSSRPTTREILQSEVINGLQEVHSEELLSSLEHDDAESELLLRFLNSLEEQKHKDALKLVEEINCLESDIKEVVRRHDLRKPLLPSNFQNGSSSQKKSVSLNEDPSSSETSAPPGSTISNVNEPRLTNLCQLESAYFSMRSKIKLPGKNAATHPDKDVLKSRENWCMSRKNTEHHKTTDALGAFFDGLCKYGRYSKFEVRGALRNPDFNNPANVICSMSFDRDEDYFATAGISKKIKVFEFIALIDDSIDIHYPVVEMSNRSKLSCICWNNYIKNYLASTDFDGVVKLWDANTGQGFSQFTEHEKRAWSVDFSVVCPTRFASGSDDCSVKLWSTSERNSLSTIRNVANVCCVNFSAHSPHLLAFGSADNSTYCYDLRNLRIPWCVLAGHRKAVSYVKFLDSETLLSASTDNTLKIWDLNKASPKGPSTSACSLTLSGHTNEKNFVGLSAANGYIACGSETNEVYAYYRSLPMPVTSYKFGSIDPISGKETVDDNGQFVSSVCCRAKSDTVVAASSSGWIKVLQMV